MIHYVKGNLLESAAEALVNTVNTVGVMGKGIALQFRETFPENYRVYREACKNNNFHVGEILVTEDDNLISGHKIIMNFPTKAHWKMPSEYSYIESGLSALKKEIAQRHIKSIAIPPLGSNNGGLDWARVKMMIEEALIGLDCDIYLYEPTNMIIERMKSERCKLTPARAMLLTMFGDMIASGEFASVFAAEKLIYFMQRFGGKDLFKIDFKPYYYGPYSGGKIAHVLYRMNGSYIKGMGGMASKPFDYIWLVDDAESVAQKFLKESGETRYGEICQKTKAFLRGYYSNYSLELLSSVDYLLEHVDALARWRQEKEEDVINVLEKEMQKWSRRKEQMFTRELLVKAVKHLKGAMLVR